MIRIGFLLWVDLDFVFGSCSFAIFYKCFFFFLTEFAPKSLVIKVFKRNFPYWKINGITLEQTK
jgi:hypothetical protein